MSFVFDVVTARLVLALARDGSIGRAAERESIAPSAISRRIADLETRLGLPLFDRTPQGVRLTAAGSVYAGECSRLMRQIADLDIRMRALASGRSGILRIAATTSALSGRLPELLSAYGGRHPDIALELSELAAFTALSALRDARVDLAIVADNHDLSEFRHELFEIDRIYVVARPDHAIGPSLDVRRPVGFSTLLDYEMVAIHQQGALDRLLDKAARDLGRSLGKRLRAETFSSLVRLVEAGFGIGFLRATGLHLLAGTDLVAAPLAEDWAMSSLQLVWRETSLTDAPLELFRELARRRLPAAATIRVGQAAAS